MQSTTTKLTHIGAPTHHQLRSSEVYDIEHTLREMFQTTRQLDSLVLVLIRNVENMTIPLSKQYPLHHTYWC